MEKEKRYVSHVIVSELPEYGMDQLFYYTVKDKSLKDKKFYWGRGNNSFDENFMNTLLDKKEVQKLNSKEYPFLIKENETLMVDSKGNICKVFSSLPLIFNKKIGKLEVEVKK